MILLVLLPLLSFVSGVASLQIDPKEQPKKKWVLVVILVLSLMGSVIASLNDNSDKKREQLAAADQKNKDDEKITMLIDTFLPKTFIGFSRAKRRTNCEQLYCPKHKRTIEARRQRSFTSLRM
jgi:hypothetical protein